MKAITEFSVFTLNKALTKANELNDSEMKSVASGMLPGGTEQFLADKREEVELEERKWRS